MDTLQGMRVFARVVDSGSFTSAAQALDLSTAQVSRLISDLEAHLQTRLLHRTTRRLALTEAGERYLERCRGILEDIESPRPKPPARTSAPAAACACSR